MWKKSKNIKVREKAITCYKEGKCTIREGAEIAGVRYFEFFDILAKENLIGTGSENMEIIFKNLED
ncbi:hypothetical protein HYY69_04550 [Candidatus Woesearchaeota archaeon]|nr:hypothetical protein [Candidatus Woesearchaeota archaeon]